LNAKTVALVFTRTDCPISNRHAPELTRLHQKFSIQGIQFWMIYVDPREPVENIRAHHRAYGYAMPALLDHKSMQELVDQVGTAGGLMRPFEGEISVKVNGGVPVASELVALHTRQ
jgi:hypothetical protein